MLVTSSRLAFRRAVEFGRPFGEGAVAVGDRRQPQGRDVVHDAHRRFQDRIGAEQVVVGEAEQVFADAVAVAQAEVAHATDLSAGSPFSIRLSAIAGCQFGRPLKSRIRAQTRSERALMTLET